MNGEVKKKKRRIGRPSKYDPKLCKDLMEFMMEGLSFEAFAGKVGVHIDTLYEWTYNHPEFSEAKKRGYALSLEFWEKLGRNATYGRIPGFNAAVWIFTMKNRFGWKDKQEISAADDKPILLAFDPSKRVSNDGDK